MTLRPDSWRGYRPALLHPAASFKLGSIGLLRLSENPHVSCGKSPSTVISYRLAEEVFCRRIYSIHQFASAVEKLCQKGGMLNA